MSACWNSSLAGLGGLVTSFAEDFKKFAEHNFGLKTEERLNLSCKNLTVCGC
jgi:hypothetical protein